MGQLLFGSVACLAIVAGSLQIGQSLASNDTLDHLSSVFFGLSILAVVLCTWRSNMPGMVKLYET